MDFFSGVDEQDAKLFDMDLTHTPDFLTDGWSASPDDLIDSFLTINGDFFKELDDSQNMQFNAISEANILAMQHQQQQQQLVPELPAIETHQQQQQQQTPPMTIDGASSAVSSLEPNDFHGFLDGSAMQQDQLDLSEYINFDAASSMGGLASAPVMSSRSSDSGLSSDNMDMDMSPDYEPLSPAMSSPGPSISERGGKNSPARSVVSDPGSSPSQEQQQPTVAAPIVVAPTPAPMPAAPVAAPIAAPLITIKTEPMPLFQPMVQKPLPQAQPQPAKTVAAQSAPVFVAQKQPQASVATTIVTSPVPAALPIASKPPQKTLVFNSSSPNIMTTNTKPRYVIEKTAAGSTVIVSESQIISPTAQKRPAPVQTTAQQPPIKKEVKFYKMAPSTMIQSAATTAPAVSSVAASAATASTVPRKFTTIQSPPKPLAHPAGTYVINKSAAGNFAGVRKLVRVQQSPIGAQNGAGGAARSILLPVSFQDVKDFRTIKIINASNLNNKQPISANIKLAAANLLQQSKQGLVQKNVCFSKEQLMDDSVSDVGTSDAESYVCEDRPMGGGNRSGGNSKTSSVVSVAVAAPQPKPIVVQQSPIIHRNVIINRSVPMSMAKIVNNHNNNTTIVHHHQSTSHSSPSHSDADDSADDDDDASDYMNGVSTAMSANGTYPKLQLTNEERRLLDKECISLPDNYPLTKHEERELKRIRRKIRNKISAQDSRKRKKEYVDGLEERVKQCTDENQTLIKRLKLLQSQHTTLSHQVKKLQAMLSKTGGAGGIGAGGLAGAVGGAGNKMTQPATCLMVLLLSLALVAAPNLKLGQSDKEVELADALQEQDALLANRRNLLFDANELVGADALADEDLLMMDEVVAATLNGNEVNEHDYAGVSRKPRSFVDFDLDDAPWRPPSRECGLLDGGAADSNGGDSKEQQQQQKLEPTFAERAAGFQETLRAATPRIVDFECGAKIAGGGVGLGAGGMYEVKLEPLDSLLAAGNNGAADAGKKLNESAKAAAGDGQGRHTILMQGA